MIGRPVAIVIESGDDDATATNEERELALAFSKLTTEVEVSDGDVDRLEKSGPTFRPNRNVELFERIAEPAILPPTPMTEHFMLDLECSLIVGMNKDYLSPQALLFWTESHYQALILGIVTGLCSNNDAYSVVHYGVEEAVKKKRLDARVVFSDGGEIILELKYVPLQYLRFPKCKNYETYVELAPSDADVKSSEFHHYESTLTWHSNWKLSNANNYLKFVVAPSIDKTYADTVSAYRDRGWPREIEDFSPSVFAETWHNGRKCRMRSLVAAARKQCYGYAAAVSQIPWPWDAKRNTKYYVLLGLWRSSMIFSAEPEPGEEGEEKT